MDPPPTPVPAISAENFRGVRSPATAEEISSFAIPTLQSLGITDHMTCNDVYCVTVSVSQCPYQAEYCFTFLVRFAATFQYLIMNLFACIKQ